jgi:hypothetical protein
MTSPKVVVPPAPLKLALGLERIELLVIGSERVRRLEP